MCPWCSYVNGEFWGIHNLRHRLDDEELARRHHVEARVDIVEDRLISLPGCCFGPRDLGRMVAQGRSTGPVRPGLLREARPAHRHGWHGRLPGLQLCLAMRIGLRQNVRCYRWTGARDSLVPA